MQGRAYTPFALQSHEQPLSEPSTMVTGLGASDAELELQAGEFSYTGSNA
jgi:hypothetical protein